MRDTARHTTAWLGSTRQRCISIAGEIRAVKAAPLEYFQSKQRVLYAGVGGGEDAALAANRGVALTLLDLSPAMLERAARKLHAATAGGGIESICADVLTPDRPGH